MSSSTIILFCFFSKMSFSFLKKKKPRRLASFQQTSDRLGHKNCSKNSNHDYVGFLPQELPEFAQVDIMAQSMNFESTLVF